MWACYPTFSYDLSLWRSLTWHLPPRLVHPRMTGTNETLPSKASAALNKMHLTDCLCRYAVPETSIPPPSLKVCCIKGGGSHLMPVGTLSYTHHPEFSENAFPDRHPSTCHYLEIWCHKSKGYIGSPWRVCHALRTCIYPSSFSEDHESRVIDLHPFTDFFPYGMKYEMCTWSIVRITCRTSGGLFFFVN